jgi:isopentenyl-diphosphate delta-isomerase
MTPDRLGAVLPNFRYRAEMNGIVENEICPVYVGLCNEEPRLNRSEVESCSWIPWPSFVDRVQQAPSSLSPWCVLETRQLLESPLFQSLLSEITRGSQESA